MLQPQILSICGMTRGMDICLIGLCAAMRIFYGGTELMLVYAQMRLQLRNTMEQHTEQFSLSPRVVGVLSTLQQETLDNNHTQYNRQREHMKVQWGWDHLSEGEG